MIIIMIIIILIPVGYLYQSTAIHGFGWKVHQQFAIVLRVFVAVVDELVWSLMAHGANVLLLLLLVVVIVVVRPSLSFTTLSTIVTQNTPTSTEKK